MPAGAVHGAFPQGRFCDLKNAFSGGLTWVGLFLSGGRAHVGTHLKVGTHAEPLGQGGCRQRQLYSIKFKYSDVHYHITPGLTLP